MKTFLSVLCHAILPNVRGEKAFAIEPHPKEPASAGRHYRSELLQRENKHPEGDVWELRRKIHFLMTKFLTAQNNVCLLIKDGFILNNLCEVFQLFTVELCKHFSRLLLHTSY